MSESVAPAAPAAPRVQREEWLATVVSFAYFFCVLAAYYVIRPVRDQLGAAVGSTQLPWFFIAIFIGTLLLTPVFAWLAGRYRRTRVVWLVHGFFIVCLLGFVPLFRHEDVISARALGTVFFVWVSVFNLFVVSVFWSVMADIWSLEQARRLFPVIALGGTAGAIAGPMLTRSLVSIIGVAPLLLVSAVLLVLALLTASWLGGWAARRGGRREAAAQDAPIGGSMFDGLRQVVADRWIRAMAILMLLGDGVGTVAYALNLDYAGATFHDAVSRTRYAASVDLATNLLQVAVQLTLTRWLLVRVGAAPVLLLWALGGTLAFGMVALSGDPQQPLLLGFPLVAIASILNRGFTFGMLGPARESLFTRMPRSLRFKGKNAVDTAVWRFGDIVVTSGMNLLRQQFGFAAAGFAALAAVSAGLSGVIGWRLARDVERGIEHGDGAQHRPSALRPGQG